jgi:hypothetical protein
LHAYEVHPKLDLLHHNLDSTSVRAATKLPPLVASFDSREQSPYSRESLVPNVHITANIIVRSLLRLMLIKAGELITLVVTTSEKIKFWRASSRAESTVQWEITICSSRGKQGKAKQNTFSYSRQNMGWYLTLVTAHRKHNAVVRKISGRTEIHRRCRASITVLRNPYYILEGLYSQVGLLDEI